MPRSNRPELDELTPAQRIAVDDGARALKELRDFRRLTFDKWMTVARGIAPLVELADRLTSRKARKNLLKDNGYGSLNDSTVSRLKHMAKLETAIRAWRDTLTQNKRDAWNSPTSIANRCPAVRKAIAEAAKSKPPRQPRASTKALAVERAFDTLSDYVHGVEDEDQRATVIERVVIALAKLLENAAPEQRYVVLMDLQKRLGFPPPGQRGRTHKPSRAQAEQTKKPTQKRATSKTTALVWKGTTAAVGGGEEYKIEKTLLWDIFGSGGRRDNFNVYFGRTDVPLRERRKVGEAATFDKAEALAERHNDKRTAKS
jgi:hypothetical protein